MSVQNRSVFVNCASSSKAEVKDEGWEDERWLTRIGNLAGWCILNWEDVGVLLHPAGWHNIRLPFCYCGIGL